MALDRDDYEERRARVLAGWHPTYPFTVTTLRDHIYCRHWVSATCAACRHRAAVSLLDLAERYGPEMTLDAVASALRCAEPECGSPEPPQITIVYDSPPTSPRQKP